MFGIEASVLAICLIFLGATIVVVSISVILARGVVYLGRICAAIERIADALEKKQKEDQGHHPDR